MPSYLPDGALTHAELDLPDGRLPGHLDGADVREPGPLPAPVDHRLDLRAGALEDGLDPSVDAVADPAAQPAGHPRAAGLRPGEQALEAAADEGARPQLL